MFACVREVTPRQRECRAAAATGGMELARSQCIVTVGRSQEQRGLMHKIKRSEPGVGRVESQSPFAATR